MKPADIQKRLDFIREAERLKDVVRNSYTSQGRRESTAEHTWRLCLMAMVFQDELGDLDFLKVLKICLLHDLGEAIGGDIPATAQGSVPDKGRRERVDLLQLMEALPAALREEFLGLWDEYENASSPEGRAAKALDKIETILQHNQGRNAPDFDYAFNLTYGRKYTDGRDLFRQIRDAVDEETRKRMTSGA
jgi:putative hydrolase of HD superfamily